MVGCCDLGLWVSDFYCHDEDGLLKWKLVGESVCVVNRIVDFGLLTAGVVEGGEGV